MGWNMKEAALACGLPAATWRLWETGGARPRDISDAAQRIAEETGADYWWIIAGPRAMLPVPDGGARKSGRRRWGPRRRKTDWWLSPVPTAA
jgi:hypothetical protein